MTSEEVMQVFDTYVIGNYTRIPVVIVKGTGSYVWDVEGNKYLDLFPGWAVSGIGHCHPKVVEAIKKQAAELIHVPNNYYNVQQGVLAKTIAEKSFGGKCFFCNSGAEANEAAIKLARIATPPEKYKIITFENSFHGRTLATITATAQPKYQKGFEPLPQGFVYAKYNDIDDVKAKVDDAACAVMIEVIQGEGGINIARKEFLSDLAQLCRDKGILLIFDEVQTGMGRTGKYFGYQHFDVKPDIMTLAKVLGGGFPIGAMVAKPAIAAKLVPGTHASTFGGSPLACSAAQAVFDAIEDENLLTNTNEMGAYILEELEKFKEKYPIIREVRGIGLMIGIELTGPGSDIVDKCLKRGLLLNCTHTTVIRFMPPMTVSKDELDEGLAIFESVLRHSG